MLSQKFKKQAFSLLFIGAYHPSARNTGRFLVVMDLHVFQINHNQADVSHMGATKMYFLPRSDLIANDLLWYNILINKIHYCSLQYPNSYQSEESTDHTESTDRLEILKSEHSELEYYVFFFQIFIYY